MSNSPEHENQQTMTPEEVRQQLLAELEASQQTVAELSDEQLEEVAGGLLTTVRGIAGTYKYAREYQNGGILRSAWAAVKNGRSAGKEASQAGYEGSSHGVTNHIYDTQYDKTGGF